MLRTVLAPVLLAVTLPLVAASLEINITCADGTAVPNAVVYAVPSRAIPTTRTVASIDQVWYEGMRTEPEPRHLKLAADGTAALAFVAVK